MKKTLFLIIILFSLPAISQKIVIDSISQKTIPFIEIYSSKGEILGLTNYKGEISSSILDKISREKLSQIYFNHANFQNRYISTEELLKSSSIYLIPFQYNAVNNLNEVVVNSGRKYKYTKVTAYFRSIQFNNEIPQYYMDGIAQYYIDLKNGKTTIYILQNRSLQDTKIKQIDEKGAIRLNFNITGVADLTDFLNYKKFKIPYKISSYNNIISKENEEVGKITVDKERLSLNLEIYSEKKPRVMKLFGSESILKNYSINAIYDNNDANNLFQNLYYFKEYREYDIKQKKASQYTHINTIHEVYVIDKELTDLKPEIHKNYYYNFLAKSNYKNNFWEDTNSDYIKPISKTVESFIEKNLSEQ